jgi:hypothetical protein
MLITEAKKIPETEMLYNSPIQLFMGNNPIINTKIKFMIKSRMLNSSFLFLVDRTFRLTSFVNIFIPKIT